MNQERQEKSYKRFFTSSFNKRRELFSAMSPESRANLIRMHAERWLAFNRRRLEREQISVVEELIRSISPEWFEFGPGYEKPEAEVEVLIGKLEKVLSREDFCQFTPNVADYIPPVEDESG